MTAENPSLESDLMDTIKSGSAWRRRVRICKMAFKASSGAVVTNKDVQASLQQSEQPPRGRPRDQSEVSSSLYSARSNPASSSR